MSFLSGLKNFFANAIGASAPDLSRQGQAVTQQAAAHPFSYNQPLNQTSNQFNGQAGGGAAAVTGRAPFLAAGPTSSDTAGNAVASGAGGVGGPAGGGTGAAAPSPLTGQFNSALNQLTGAYNSLFGNIDQATGSAGANLQQGYGAQLGNLNNQYAQAQQQLPWEYAARGANQSSWGENAFNSAQNQYNNSVNQLQSAQSSDLANIAKQGAAAKATGENFVNTVAPQLQALFPNMDQYQQSYQISNLLNQLGQVQGDIASNQTIGALQSQMANNPTYQDQGASILKAQLDQLAQSGAPTAVQNQIAQGIMGNPNNPFSGSYWQNYWQSLQNPVKIGV